MNNSSLSVITPSYNTADFIEDALLSVSRQKGVPVEHIVIDGASTDNSLEIVKRYPKAQWISEPDRGQSDAINKGFLRATGDLVGWLNADDYYLPGGLAAIARAAQEHPEADVIHGDCVFVDSAGKIVRSKVEHDFDRDPDVLWLLYPLDLDLLSAPRPRLRLPAGLRLSGVYGLRVLRPPGSRRLHLSLCAAIHRGLSLARQQRQP
jgi:glycosyltransferase involved in cell wall biosynthesis